MVRACPPIALLFVPLSACALTPAPSASTGVTVSQDLLVRGVVAAAADPSIVRVLGGSAVCSGTVLSASVVLTARQCVTEGATNIEGACSEVGTPLSASSVRVESFSPDAPASVATALSVVAPSGTSPCTNDVALLVLETPLVNAVRRSVSTSSIAAGGHYDTLGWASANPSPLQLLFREHVAVGAADAASAPLEEESCTATAGGPAIDEATGDVVGVLTGRSGPCGASSDVYTQLAPFGALIQTALAAGEAIGETATSAPKPTASVGDECTSADDCATSVCIASQGAEFCSRPCSATDTCPTESRCTTAGNAGEFCFPD